MYWIKERYHDCNDTDLYYDGYLNYGDEKKVEYYMEEYEMISKIEEVRNNIIGYGKLPDYVLTRGRYNYKYNCDIEEFIHYNDIIMDVYKFRYEYETTDFEELKMYFMDGSFLEDSKLYLKALNYYMGGLKASHSLKDGSKGEELVRKILKEKGYEFKEQENDGCYNLHTFKPLIFDFIIYVNNIKVYVEVQGKQHYEPVGFNGEDNKTKERIFYNQKIRDNIKKEYAEKNGIFIELDYSEANLKKLKNRINKQLIPTLKKIGGGKNDN